MTTVGETISLKEAWDIFSDKIMEVWFSEKYLGRNSLTQSGEGSEYWKRHLDNASISKMFVEVISQLPNDYMWEITDDNSAMRVESLSCYKHHHGKKVKVGWVTLDYYEEVVELRNFRIRKNMERKDHMTTGDAKKLSKDIKRWFKPLSYPEQLQERMTAMKRRIDTETIQAQYVQNQEVGKAMSALTDHVMTHLNEFKPLLTMVHSEERLDELAKIYADTQLVLSLTRSKPDAKGVLHSAPTTRVLITDDCLVAHNGNWFETYNHDDIPYEMRKKLGVLKLVDDETFVVNVGYRDRSDLFTLSGDMFTEERNRDE
jgi:hypothetical protein